MDRRTDAQPIPITCAIILTHVKQELSYYTIRKQIAHQLHTHSIILLTAILPVALGKGVINIVRRPAQVSRGATQAYTEDLAGGFSNLRSDWRNFLVNCGTVADRFMAYTYAEITYFTIFPPFFLDFENNGTVKISEFFCVGLAIENKFLDRKLFGV